MSIWDKIRGRDTSRRTAAETAVSFRAAKKREQEMIERQELRFNTYCIGIGRAGIHFLDSIYALDKETQVNQVFPLALPSSRYDYQLAENLKRKEDRLFPFGASNRDVRYTGVGGDQHLGQQIAFEEGRRVLKKIDEDIRTIDKRVPVEAIILIGSLAGGTGGGSIPVLAKMIKDNFPDQVLMIMGILPEKQEGNTFFVNASRSFNMIMNLRDELPDEYVDTVFIFENMIIRKAGMLQSYKEINQQLAKTFNLMFGSSYSPDTLDPHDKISTLKKGGKKGIALTYYTGDQRVENPNPETDLDIEDAKAEIIRMFEKNLREYPSGTVESGRFGAYHIRCNQNIFPFDVRNILNSTFEMRLEGGNHDKHAFVRGGIWPAPMSEQVEIATMILEIDPTKYEYLKKIMNMWSLWYEKEDVVRDFEQIRTSEVAV